MYDDKKIALKKVNLYITLFTQILVFVLVSSTVFANKGNVVKENFHYTQFSIADGLPSSEIYEIFQDSKGYLWIGTDKGVSRYNGRNFENYTTKDGLSDNTIFLIREDYKGRIWFIGLQRKLCYFENNKFHSYKYNKQLVQSFQNLNQGYAFSKFEVSEEDEITISVAYKKCVRIDSFGKVSAVNIKLIENIHQKANGVKSLSEFVARLTSSELKYIGRHPIRLFTLGKYEKVFFVDNTLFFTSIEGVTIVDWKNPSASQDFLPEFKVTCIGKDFEGGLWFGTQYNGIIHVPNRNIKKFKLSGLEHKKYFHGIITQKNMPVFMFGNTSIYNGISFVINQDSAQLDKFQDPIKLLDISDEQLRRGIRLESNTHVKELKNGIHAAIRFNDSTIITASSYNLLFIWNVKNGKLTSIFKNTNTPKIMDFYKVNNTELLIGTSNGLFTMDMESYSINKVQSSLPFSDLRIQDLDQNNAGDIIVATRGNGLFIWSELEVKPFGANSGLKTDIINQIFYDNSTDEIYVSSNKGVSKLLGSHLVVNLINENHGLESSDVRQFMVSNDTLYIANNISISYLPMAGVNNVFPKPFLYENHSSMNDSIPLSDDLKWNENNLKIKYTGISFKSRKGVLYSYRITPLQKEWHITNDDELNFENLVPNHYVLEIRAVNNMGLYSNSLKYEFTVHPIWYKQFWFKILIAVILLVLIYVSTSQAIKYYQHQLQVQKNIKQLQSLSLQAKMNPHFIFNSLNSIQNFILKNEKEAASEYLLDFAQLARLTIANSDATTVSLFNELKTLRLYTKLEEKRIRRNYQYTEKIDTKIDLKACHIPSLLLQPYIENAIWHGRIHTIPNGFVELKIELNNNILYFEITDNGIGVYASKKLKNKLNFNSASSNQINAERINLISDLHSDLSPVEIDNAFYDDEKEEWYGTRVSFSLPYELIKTKPENHE